MTTQTMHSPAGRPQDRALDALPWYRHRWPWLLMLGPALVVLAGAVTIWLALRSQDALVVDDYYKQGKAINQDLRRAKNAASLGLGMTLAYDPAQGRLQGQMQGEAARRTALKLRLVHSTQAAKDLLFQVETDASGKFAVDLPMLEMARWQVVVEDADRHWQLQGAWKWPAERSLRIASESPPGQ